MNVPARLDFRSDAEWAELEQLLIQSDRICEIDPRGRDPFGPLQFPKLEIKMGSPLHRLAKAFFSLRAFR